MPTVTAAKERLVLQSPAKVNLGLEVLGKRGDGFHSIRSVLIPISLHDSITILPGGRKLVFHGGQGAPKDEANLAFRAAQILSERTGTRHGLTIRIVKRIPIASGLGGGSSNAATCLKALNELWDLNLSVSELEKLGLALGSDVPFFIRGGTCLAGGRGEDLQRLPVQGTFHFILVTPPLRVSSQWAYEQVSSELTRSGSSTSMIKVALASHRVELLAAHLANDLEAGVVANHPVIGDIKKKLIAAGALAAQMSGSGPTVFGLAASKEDAERIEHAMVAEEIGKVVRASSIEE